jgi:hypothetical protein
MTLVSGNSPPRAVVPGEQVRPEAGENTLSLTVRNGDGIEKTIDFISLPRLWPDKAINRTGILSGKLPFPPLSAAYQAPELCFRADLTGLTFSEFVDAQTFKDRSLVDAATVPQSWVVPDSPVYDGKSWKAASRQSSPIMGIPRNFLNEQDIFQFETLAFDAAYHTRIAVEAILAGTFMSPDHEKNREKLDYAGLIMQPLIKPRSVRCSSPRKSSRRWVETGSPPGLCRLPGYEGAYNFYNIGATPNPSVPDGAGSTARFTRCTAESRMSGDHGG